MAKDVITRFKLESTQYDSKIKNAAKELSDVAKAAKSAGSDFERFTKDQLAAARALGTIAASSTNAKDKAKELVGAFNDVARSYNQLTDAQKRSDFGKAVADSLTALQQRIRETKQDMQSMESKSGGLFGGNKMSGMLQVMGGNLMTKGVTLAAGAITSMANEIGDAVKQGIELAKQGEGIRIAFERLGRGDILDGLREATHGTVTDIELMKAAVKFNDFKLPVEELGTMLAFAQQKAKDTGQSVDYMVDSIVTGLGRKSLMILDNLGLSATEIRERMKETGDMTKAVGDIIREQMAKAGDYVETAADRAAQANVSLQNKMEELGRKFAPVEEASNQLWTSMKIGILDVVGGPLAELLNRLTEAGRMANQYNIMGGNSKVGGMTKRLSDVSEGKRQGLYQQQTQEFWKYINPREQQLKDIQAWQSGKRSSALQGRINAITEKYGSLDTTKIQAEVDAAKKMLLEYQQAAKTILAPIKAEIDTSDQTRSLADMKKQLADLQAQRKKYAAGSDEAKNLDTQIRQLKADIKLQDPTAFKSGRMKKEQTEIQKNQETINKLSQEYAKLGDDATESARKRQEEIQKEIELLKERNGLLGLREAQAQGRLMLTGSDINIQGLGNVGGTGVFDDAMKKAGEGIKITTPLQLDDKTIKKVQESLEKGIKSVNLTKEIGNISSGVGQVFGSLEQLGIELPDGLTEVVGGMQSVISLLTGITSIITAIEAIAGADAIIPFAGGGIVKAAGGTIVGNSYSGDNLRGIGPGGQLYGLNAGEVVLNRAESGIIASALDGAGSGFKNGTIVGVLEGEKIKLVLNRHYRRIGEGEIVTWKNG